MGGGQVKRYHRLEAYTFGVPDSVLRTPLFCLLCHVALFLHGKSIYDGSLYLRCKKCMSRLCTSQIHRENCLYEPDAIITSPPFQQLTQEEFE